jgi:hypothetical protein
MSERTATRRHARRAALYRELPGIAILVAAFVAFASLSWRTWPDILVDFGVELYVPWRLSIGEVLYKDIAWVTGPFSQYANSLLFRLVGVSLSTLIAANLTLLAIIVAMLYWLFRRCGTRGSALFVVLFFLAVFAFSQYTLIGNYNYVCPYRHDMTHGLALGLCNLICLIQFNRSSRARWLVAGGTCLGLITLAKVEMALAAWVTTAAALLLVARQMGPLARSGAASESGPAISALLKLLDGTSRWAGIVAVSAAAPVVIALAALAIPLGWAASFRNVFLQYRLALFSDMSTSSPFYRQIVGMDHVAENLMEMVLMSVVVLAVTVVAYLAETMAPERTKHVKIWAAALGIAAFGCGAALISPNDWGEVPACPPLLLIPVILFSLRHAVRDAKEAEPATALFLTAIYGISLLPKILLYVRWRHYGFVLAAPGTLVLIHVAWHSIPAWFARHRRSGWCFRAIAAGLLTACALSLFVSWLRVDLRKTVTMGAGGDRFYSVPTEDSRTLPTEETLRYLREHIAKGDTLIVFPNGAMLNYLLRARNPTPYLMFSPWESDVHGGEDRIADEVIRAAPDYTVIVTMDMTIHGRGNFGDGEFGGRIRKFLDEHYDVVYEATEWGIDGRPFVSTVFKHRTKSQ